MKIQIKIIAVLFTIVSNFSFAQDTPTVKVTTEIGSKNPEIQNLYDFENILIEKFNFESEKLKGKTYTIKIVEFKDGKETDTTVLFSEKVSANFKINSTKMGLKFNVKLDKENLKVGLVGDGFRTQALDFKLDANNRYTVKDFFGDKSEINLDINSTNSLLAINSMKKDIHYYLIQIDFK